MLKAPLRKCTFHERAMPATFLSRFTIGLDSNTKLTWAVPTLGEKHERGPGQGRYVAQNEQVLNSFQKTARYKYTFRNKAVYRSDMTDLIQSKLSEIALKATRANLGRTSSIAALRYDADTWTVNGKAKADNLSFALLFKPSSAAEPKKEPVRSIQNVTDGRSLSSIPFYDVDAIWGSTVADSLKQQLDIVNIHSHSPLAIAFTLDRESLKNATGLWKLAGFFRTVDNSIS
ncbi:hypothetical protein BGW37DRAFT_498820 [Umbelopsis sp. PMI_123]|nr:hypothetical protein BGW37DRAFT_498820 [Umbelopsis sp. PMI_123]